MQEPKEIVLMKLGDENWRVGLTLTEDGGWNKTVAIVMSVTRRRAKQENCDRVRGNGSGVPAAVVSRVDVSRVDTGRGGGEGGEG